MGCQRQLAGCLSADPGHWRHHRIDVDPGVGGAPGVRHVPTRPVPTRPVPWHHDPAHRGGVPYRDPVSRTKFEGTPDLHSVRSNYRGYYPARPEPVPLKNPAGRAFAAPSSSARPPVAERPMPAPDVRRPAPPIMPRPPAVPPTPAAVEAATP